jgi:hypothetical protein
MRVRTYFSNQELHTYKKMGAPGLAFETWDPPSKGSSSPAPHHSSSVRVGTSLAVLLLTILISPTMFADTQSPPDPNKNPNGGEKAGPGGFTQPSMSVRPADRGRLRTSATTILGWRLGARTRCFHHFLRRSTKIRCCRPFSRRRCEHAASRW